MADTAPNQMASGAVDSTAHESDNVGSNLPQDLETDAYDEDEAELRFLHSKPTCFIVLGKPGSGKTTIARRLAMEWKCELLNGTDVLLQAIDMQTEMGIKAQEILLRGEAIPEDMMARMLEEKINSPEVAHHGYILDDFPSLSEEFMSVRDQLELVNNWSLKPDFIINLKIPDKDLETRRVGFRMDPNDGQMYTREMYAPDKTFKMLEGAGGEEEEAGGEEEEEEQTAEEVEEFPELTPDVLERLVKRPEDLQNHVTDTITKYKSNMLRILEDYIADHDQQYVIELDSNKPVPMLFRELLSRLGCFVLRPAAVPIRLNDADDEELPEDLDTEELLRTCAAKKMVAPRFRWRRSRWLRYCPVALSEGNLVQGRPEFAVSFLDKMYFLSSAEAMGNFLKNPRPYLLPPQPRPPCKVIVTGPPTSGKTTLCHQLALKYNAKVLDIDELIKPRMEEERKKVVDTAREEATENAIIAVKTQIREQIEAEMAKEEAKAETPEDTGQDTEQDDAGTDGGGAEDEERAKSASDHDVALEASDSLEDKTTSEETIEGATEGEEADPSDSGEMIAAESDPVEEVTATHPEVQTIVEAAVKAAETQPISLSAEVYVEIMEEAIKATEKEMRESLPEAPLNGGWILDHFPRTRDQWSLLVEKNLLPDDIICLNDDSETGDTMLKRWYQDNRQEIDEKIRVRKEQEEQERLRQEEEARIKAEEERLAAEEAERIALEEERQRRLEAGEELPEDESQEPGQEEQGQEKGGLEEEEAKEDEEEEQEESPEAVASKTEKSTSGEVSTDVAEQEETVSPAPPSPGINDLPPEGPELEAQKQLRKAFDTEWSPCHALITGNTMIQPLILDVINKPEESPAGERNEEELCREAVIHLERQTQYVGWELQGMDIDEEEEDAEADQEEEMEEEAGEEEEDPNRAVKKALGDTSYFCPVALKENGVLWPGNPEIAAKYRERIYYLSTSDNRDKFLATPTQFLPNGKPFSAPPIRILILGPKGAGKTLHGRNLANKLGLFHIQFRERLQELIIAKTKKKIGPEYEEEEEEKEEEEQDEEEEASPAITGPDSAKGTTDNSDTPNLEKEVTGVSSAADSENKEEEEEELTEEEEAIKAYLETEESLPTELLDKIVKPWWFEEPFRSTGFILEGFPHSVEETSYLADTGLFPDTCILLVVEDTDVFGRLLPPKLDKWKQKRDRRLAKKQKAKDKAQKKREAEIAKRREELLKEREERRAERKAERGLESDEEAGSDAEEEEEDEDEENIEDILAEEFEEEEEDDDDEEELEEDAVDRMQNDLAEVYDNDTNRLAAVQEKLADILVPRVEVDAGRKPHIVRYSLSKRLRTVTQCRHSLFERVFPINERLAVRMLQLGYKQPSRFGRWCPVQLSEGECLQPMQGAGYSTFPAIYRQYIYFLSSAQARETFMQDPLTNLQQASPKPVVPIRMAIIGPPKSGKTTLAGRFAQEYGIVRLSIGEAVRMVLETQPKSELSQNIIQHLQKGLVVPDELAVQAVEVALMDMRCQTRGFILDGFPLTKYQVELMTERSIIPLRVIELQCGSMEIGTRATKDRYSPDRLYPVHDSAQILAIRMAKWQKEIGQVREWYQQEHSNWQGLDGERSKWWVWHKALDLAKTSVMQIQTYLECVADGKAASIADMCITPKEFEVRLGDYNMYCPVSLALRGELVDCSVTSSLKYAAEFRGHYYKLAGPKELEEFLATPEKFVPPLAPHKLPPPDMLPKRRTGDEAKAMFPTPIELQGYCPVTFLDGKLRYEAIVPGDPELVVEYRAKLYYFHSEECLQKFMRLPEKYWNLKLPHKLPPRKDPLLVTGLPMLGYMEQTAATGITKALTAVGNFKPKYPFLSPSKSALVYVAYHLKAYNPKSSDYVRKKYKKKLMHYEDTCELINYLGDKMTRRYKEPGERPIDFDFKLETFLQLKGKEPTTTWVA